MQAENCRRALGTLDNASSELENVDDVETLHLVKGLVAEGVDDSLWCRRGSLSDLGVAEDS